jgi:hypothetical protein
MPGKKLEKYWCEHNISGRRILEAMHFGVHIGKKT